MPNTETKKKDSVERIVEMLTDNLILEKDRLINALKEHQESINLLYKENQLIKARLKKLEQVKDDGVELDG